MEVQSKEQSVDVSVNSDSEDMSVGVDDQDVIPTKEKQEEIAEGESKAVVWLRVLVLCVLVISTLSVVLGVYFYMSGAEEEDFENKFNSDADKVVKAIGKTLDQTLGATDAFIVKMVAYARYSNSDWPFVTLPAFSIQATKLLRLSKAFQFSMSHIVAQDERDDWQRYANATHGWIDESFEIQANDEDWHGSLARDYVTSYDINGFAGSIQDPSPHGNNTYMPSWQQAPMIPNSAGSFPYNWDAWEIPDVAAALVNMFETQRVVVSGAGNIIEDPNDPWQVAMAEAGRNWARAYISPDDDPAEPISVITYPVIDSLESVRINIDEEQSIVAVLTFAIFWRELLRDILPLGSDGVLVVFENPCGADFTYQLDGPSTTYLGVGDLHDPKYNHLGHSTTLPDLMDTSTSERDSSYTGIPLSTDYCITTLKVFPSQVFEDDHVTSDPIIFTLIIAFIFLFTSAVFITYDCLVSRRQRIVMDRALKSGAIVSSLFPEKVRNQLYQEQEDRLEKESNTKTFVHDANDVVKGSKPMADLFEETTIMFADLAGFTAWSSKRSPTQVFELLECIYSSFDAIAERRGVFKVETIGDCYVAVTGIPEPQADHAIIMARFARDCMMKMSQLAGELGETLGADTMDLEMRIGLHSGPTTAGVLRGQKSRFQLFGDTVNTAARMESNGTRGRIHVSQSTADELIARGKEQWVTPREDKIVAKGKGEMQTYWVQIKTGKTAMSHCSSDNALLEV
jgi:class 3 adenylate cyclase